ncbi:MAG TPA: choline/ethanolamine kinase family protein [Candidatus Limnocylindrales bacterium]
MPVQPPSPTIEDVVAAIPAWRGRAISVEPIGGGLTNRNYRVDVDGAPRFVRIPGPATDLLAIDRANELHNTRAAAVAGVGPRVLDHLPDWNVMVLEWLPGRTMSNAAFADPRSPARIAEVLRRLHGGPRFQLDFDMFRLTETYLGVAADRDCRIPAGFREALPAVGRIETALGRSPLPSVPCHNDLLAENYLDDRDRLWIVDYEYSGNNDPTFELGNTCQELGFDDDRATELCAAYFGTADPALLARMRLQMIMSDVGWTLWAAIQDRISTIDYDFWGWAEERWGRASASLAGPGFDGWLAAV